MAFNGATRKLLLPRSSPVIRSLSTCSSSQSSSKVLLPSNHHEKNEEKSIKIKVKRPLLMIKQLPLNSLIIHRTFYHRPIIHLNIQHSGPHGILFDALQKTRVSIAKSTEIQHHYLDIPDELRRLKSGSLKWLLAVWPGTKKSYSALTTIKSALQQEQGTGGDNDKDLKRMVSKTEGALRSQSEQQLFDVLDYLKSRNIAIRRLVKLPWLLTADPQALEKKVEQVKRYLKIKDFKVAISFANIENYKLMEIGNIWRREVLENSKMFENKIDWMAGQLRCPSEDISDMMSRSTQLIKVPPQVILEVLNILINECGVKPEAIVNDPWVFSSNLKTLKSRAGYLKELDIQDLKPWIFRSPQRIFDNFIKKKLDQRELLGDHKDITGYLQDKLKYPDLEGPQEILQKVPSLKTATVIKLNEMIEFLISAGFEPEQIRETPRILAHSVETIAERLKEVTAFKTPVQNLQLLCRTSKDYRAIIRKFNRDAKANRAVRSSLKSKKLIEV